MAPARRKGTPRGRKRAAASDGDTPERDSSSGVMLMLAAAEQHGLSLCLSVFCVEECLSVRLPCLFVRVSVSVYLSVLVCVCVCVCVYMSESVAGLVGGAVIP